MTASQSCMLVMIQNIMKLRYPDKSKITLQFLQWVAMRLQFLVGGCRNNRLCFRAYSRLCC